MKKIITIVILLALAFSLTGCVKDSASRPDNTTDTIELIEVSKWSQERVEKKLIGEYRGNILHSWGEPQEVISETTDKYFLDEENSKYIILYYDNEDCIYKYVFGDE